MLQQINFYTLLPKKSGFQLTPRWLLSIYSVFLLLLIFIYGVALYQKQQVLSQYTRSNNQMQMLEKQLLSLTQQYPISDATALKNSVHDLQEKLASKRKLLNSLTSKAHFSTYLQGLAAVNVQGIWFTEIVFNHPEQTIDLKGLTLQSRLVEELLTQLNQESTFATLPFAVQDIAENTKPPGFAISAKAEVTP